MNNLFKNLLFSKSKELDVKKLKALLMEFNVLVLKPSANLKWRYSQTNMAEKWDEGRLALTHSAKFFQNLLYVRRVLGLMLLSKADAID